RIVSGSFRQIAATISSVNPAAGEIVVKDLATKKTLTVRVNSDSTMRRLPPPMAARSEEHTSELQSRFDLVCRLLLEKKKINIHTYSRQTPRHSSTRLRLRSSITFFLVRHTP